MKQEILGLIKKRNKLFLKANDDEQIDLIGHEIIKQLWYHIDILEVDFIIESVTHLGAAPSIVYDDNGMFAVSDQGFNQLVTGKERIEGTIGILVGKEMWRKTIRKALKYWFKDTYHEYKLK